VHTDDPVHKMCDIVGSVFAMEIELTDFCDCNNLPVQFSPETLGPIDTKYIHN